jgi:hypothetical protein
MRLATATAPLLLALGALVSASLPPAEAVAGLAAGADAAPGVDRAPAMPEVPRQIGDVRVPASTAALVAALQSPAAQPKSSGVPGAVRSTRAAQCSENANPFLVDDCWLKGTEINSRYTDISGTYPRVYAGIDFQVGSRARNERVSAYEAFYVRLVGGAVTGGGYQPRFVQFEPSFDAYLGSADLAVLAPDLPVICRFLSDDPDVEGDPQVWVTVTDTTKCRQTGVPGAVTGATAFGQFVMYGGWRYEIYVPVAVRVPLIGFADSPRSKIYNVSHEIGTDSQVADTRDLAATNFLQVGPATPVLTGSTAITASTGTLKVKGGAGASSVRIRRATAAAGRALGAFGAPFTVGPNSSVPTGSLAQGATACFSATSLRGTVSGSASAPRCVTRAVDDRSLTASKGGWTAVSSPRAANRTLRTSKRVGATLTLSTAIGSGITLFVKRAPGAGKVAVIVGGKTVATYSLASAGVVNQAAITLKAKVSRGPVVIKVTSAGRAGVSIDAVAVTR